MINVGGNLPPEILQQQQALNRQQQMAQLLMQQGQSMPSGQMVSGRYVAPSFFQYAAPLAQMYAGTRLAEKGDKTALDIAKQLRQQYANEAQQYQNILRGQEQTFEQAGPTQTGGNIPNQTYRTGADPQAAYLFGSTAYNPVLQQASAKKMLEGPKYKEVTQFNQQTGNTEIYRYDENSQNPRETMQFLGISKPAISPEAQIRFGDEGIGIPVQFRGGATTQGQPTSAYGANVQFTPNQLTARPQGQPMGQPVGQAQVTPTIASTQAYDPFKAPPAPAGLSGKQTREFVSEQNKPLTGKPADQVTGAINYQKSLDKVQNLLDIYKGPQLLDPNVRAQFKAAIRTAQLQGKEAFGLGVLNGPDLDILEQVISDPTAFDAFLKDRNTINKLYNNQREFTSEAIKTNYRAAQKAVPSNLRQYVEITPKELTPDSKDGKLKAQVTIQRAILNNEPIETRNGKWVYSKTGKAVE
jgi:hypothetical protein